MMHLLISNTKKHTSWKNGNLGEKEALLCHPGIAYSVHKRRTEERAWGRCLHPEADESGARPAGSSVLHRSSRSPAAMKTKSGWALENNEVKRSKLFFKVQLSAKFSECIKETLNLGGTELCLILDLRFRRGTLCPNQNHQMDLISSLTLKREFARAALRNRLEGGEPRIFPPMTPFPQITDENFSMWRHYKKKCKCIREGDIWDHGYPSFIDYRNRLRHHINRVRAHLFRSLHFPLRSFSKLFWVLLLSVLGLACLRWVLCS